MDPLYVPDSNNFIGSSVDSLIVTDADYSKHTLVKSIEYTSEIDLLPGKSKNHITRESETTNAAEQEYHCVKEVTRKQNLNEEKIPIKNADHLWESSECGEHSVQKIGMEKHSRMYNYSQQTCGQNFSLQGTLNCHDEMSHGLKYICPKCPYKINRKDSLNKHIKRMHEISYDYECDICVKKFKTKDVLTKHKNLVHTEMQSINCDECDHVSKNLHALKEHKRIKHFKSEFFCKICKQYFRTQDNLEQHSKRHNMACPTCGKTITRYDNLKEHMRLHTNEKPNVCNVYGKAYAQKTGLSMQMKKHSGLLPKSSAVP